jgi:hypothetical protein
MSCDRCGLAAATQSVQLRRTMRDRKWGSGLRAIAFGVIRFTPEADVQDRRTCRRVGNNPIEKRSSRIELRRNAEWEGSAAIQRQINFQLTPRQVHIGKNCPAFDPDLLPGMRTCPAAGEISLATYRPGAAFESCDNGGAPRYRHRKQN